MPTPPWTDDHARLVATAAPEVPDASQEELDRAWSRVRDGLDVPARRRRTARLVIGAGIAAVLLAGGGVAAAGVFSAHTGRYPVDAEDLRLGGPGEKLDPAAPDFAAVVSEVTGDVPFPSERVRERALRILVGLEQRSDPAPGTTAVSTGAVRFFVARAAVCTWGEEWSTAVEDGDASRVARARAALEAAPTWPAVAELDPDQVIEYRWIESVNEETGEKGRDLLPDNTPAGYFPLLRDAATDGDLAALGTVLVRWGACFAELVPDYPAAVPPSMRRR